jgi:hypothetical protein
MSATEIAERLSRRIAERGRAVAHPDAVPLLFEGFKTELLLQADDKADGQVTGICAKSAIQAADHRMQKQKRMGMEYKDGVVLFSDFVPAFEYISDLCVAKNRLHFPAEDVKVFTWEISELITQACPWC